MRSISELSAIPVRDAERNAPIRPPDSAAVPETPAPRAESKSGTRALLLALGLRRARDLVERHERGSDLYDVAVLLLDFTYQYDRCQAELSEAIHTAQDALASAAGRRGPVNRCGVLQYSGLQVDLAAARIELAHAGFRSVLDTYLNLLARTEPGGAEHGHVKAAAGLPERAAVPTSVPRTRAR